MGFEETPLRPDLSAVQAILDYHFEDPALLAEALTHSSWAHGHGVDSNERLEFIGDSILNACTTTLIARRFPEAREGALSRLRAQLVDERTLAKVALARGLAPHLRLDRGEEKTGGRRKMRVLADLTEALIGAVYLDAGFERCLALVRTWLSDRLESLDPEDDDLDQAWKHPRSALQELTQGRWGDTPEYHDVDAEGPAHQPLFTVEVSVEGRVLGRGRAGSKHEARKRAAEDALYRLHRGEEE